MKKLLAIFCLLLTYSNLSWATFGAATAWNVVASTGSDTHGGAFDSGVVSPGTDESLGSGTAITVTLTGTTTGTGSPAFTSTTHGPGNFVYIASGSGCTTGFFEVLSQSVGVATFDHAMGSATNVCTGTIGGALADVNTAIGEIVAANIVWCNGTTTITTTLAISVNVNIQGFTSTHGDATNNAPCTITTSTNSVTLAHVNGVSVFLSNLISSSTAVTPGNGWECQSTHACEITTNYVKVAGFAKCVDGDNNGSTETWALVKLVNTEVTGCTTSAVTDSGGNSPNTFSVIGSNIHDNPGTAGTIRAVAVAIAVVSDTIVANNGADGFDCSSSGDCIANNNTFFNNGGYAVSVSSSTPQTLQNNVVYGNNIVCIPPSGTNAFVINNNAFGDNGTNPYPGTNAIILTANPFVASGSGNFALNNTAGGGALLIGAGAPGQFPIGYTTTGYPTVGAVQPQTSSGSGSSGYTTVQ